MKLNIEQVKTYLEKSELKSLHQYLEEANPVDIADILADLDDTQLAVAFRLLDKRLAASVFSYFEDDIRNRLIKTFNNTEMVKLFNELYTDDAVDFLSTMPANLVTNLLDKVNPDVRKDINALLQYEDDTAGSIMTVEFIEITSQMTVAQTLAKIKRVGIDSETVYTCYVIHDRKLIGIVSAKNLMLSDSDVKIEKIMKTDFVSAHTSDDKEEVVRKLQKYGLISLPVLDEENCIVGIVTFDDAIEVLEDEVTEDMMRMAAMSGDDNKPYLSTTVWEHAKSRIVWLMILMFSATITGAIISRYEAAFEALPILVSFIPMLMDTGGNCGSQSSTVVIRGLAIEEIKFKDFFKVVLKEFEVGLVVSTFLALANGLRILLIYHQLKLALVVSVSIMLTVIISKLVGCILPIAAKKINLDPAIMAAPVITTVVDTVAIIIYFSIASHVFSLVV